MAAPINCRSTPYTYCRECGVLATAAQGLQLDIARRLRAPSAADTPDTCCKTCSAFPLRVEVLFQELFWLTGHVGRQNSGVDPVDASRELSAWCCWSVAGKFIQHPVGPPTLGASSTQGLQIETVPFRACRSHAFHATENLDSPHRIVEFCTPVEVSMEVVFFFFSAAVRQKQ